MGGLFVAGLAIGRFLKASREDRENDRRDRLDYDRGYPSPAYAGTGYSGTSYAGSSPYTGRAYGASDMDRADRLADRDAYGDRRDRAATPGIATVPSNVDASAVGATSTGTTGMTETSRAGTATIDDDLGSTGRTAAEKREIAKGTADAVNPAATTKSTSGATTAGLKGEVH